jgi:hypothetical protein
MVIAHARGKIDDEQFAAGKRQNITPAPHFAQGTNATRRPAFGASRPSPHKARQGQPIILPVWGLSRPSSGEAFEGISATPPPSPRASKARRGPNRRVLRLLDRAPSPFAKRAYRPAFAAAMIFAVEVVVNLSAPLRVLAGTARSPFHGGSTRKQLVASRAASSLASENRPLAIIAGVFRRHLTSPRSGWRVSCSERRTLLGGTWFRRGGMIC